MIPTLNNIIYSDCLDPIQGLPSLPNQSFDLGFIDPPFNIDLCNNPNNGKAFSAKESMHAKSFYDDCMDEAAYEALCIAVLQEMIRICKKVVVYCGRVNQGIYYRFQDPLDEWIYFLPFNTIITNTAWAGRFQPLLIYTLDKNSFLGRPKGQNCKMDSNVIESPNRLSNNICEREVIVKQDLIFYSKSERERKKKLIHPCPIDEFLIHAILSQLKPASFLDPFVGSGTTLRAAKELHIPFLGYEKNPAYKSDINYLLDTAQIVPRMVQSSISKFL